ncbi:MAG: alpha/beta hydrolase [Clostridia bacterium]|nr:alpha/beta hydrolase [Clostridia bacterium]
MKKALSLILAVSMFALVFSLFGCGEEKQPEQTTAVTTTTQTTTFEQTTATVATTTTESTTSQTEPELPPETTIPPVKPEYPVDIDMEAVKSHALIPLWGEGEAPYEIEDKKVRDKFYHEATIQAYLVEGSDRCVIVYPGGGYGGLTAAEGGVIAQEYNKKGISAFVCNYRQNKYTKDNIIAYHRDAFLADGQRAVQFVRYYAQAFGIDPEKIAVCGFSAGGHLAMYVCEHEVTENIKGDEIGKVSSTPNLCILSYAVTVLEPGVSTVTTGHIFHSDKERADKELIAFYSYNYAPEKMPPTYIWYSKLDKTVDFNICSVQFAEKLESLGITVKCDGFSDGGHGTGLSSSYPDSAKWFDNSVNFINEIFG